MGDSGDMITLQEAAGLCAVDTDTVREWVRRGRLTATREDDQLLLHLGDVLALPESRAATEAELDAGSEFYRLRREGLLKKDEFAELLREIDSRPPEKD